MRNQIIVLLVLTCTATIISSVYAQTETTPAPLKQLSSGTASTDVICKPGLELIIKKEDGSPACVKSDTATKLVERGWAESGIKKFVVIGTVDVSSLPKLVPNNNTQLLSPLHEIPLPPISVTPTISSSTPNVIKIVSIGMSPNPIMVGDIPEFTVTYRNISDKPIYGNIAGNLDYTILPSYLLQEMPALGRPVPTGYEIINPNQTVTELGGAYKGSGYKIIQPGLLNITMNLDLHDNSPQDPDVITETIRFSINVTK